MQSWAVLFLFLSLALVHSSRGAVNSTSTSSSACSRGISRKVRKFLEKEIFSSLSIRPVDLPLACPLNPLRDLYHKQETSKNKIDYDEWKVGLLLLLLLLSSSCLLIPVDSGGENNTIAAHNSSSPGLPEEAVPICLADLCPVFGCRSSESRVVDDRKAKEQSQELSDHFQHVLSASVLDRHERCTPEKLQYVQMICEDLATRCFDSLLPSGGGGGGGKGISVGEKFRSKVCVNLRCQRGLLEGGIRPEVAIVSNSFFYRIIRLLVVVIILIIACFQVTLSDHGALSWMFRSSSQARRDPLAAYSRRAGGGGGGGLWQEVKLWLWPAAWSRKNKMVQDCGHNIVNRLTTREEMTTMMKMMMNHTIAAEPAGRSNYHKQTTTTSTKLKT
eukprot:scaffold90_cov163-Ochromonas_danica.AAC.32